MINLNQLTYFYGQQAMEFSLNISAGEKIAILGPSGAGKSTLLNLIAGFIMAERGSLVLDGKDCLHTPPAQRPVSMLFQENNLFAHLNVEENIALGIHPGLKLTQQQRQSRLEIMAKSGLTDFSQRLPAQLSGGQRQRVALARCLVRQQPILLLDEPFSALDPALRFDMLKLVKAMCKERNLTLLMVSHNIDDAVRIAERTLIIAKGNIYYDGPTQTLTHGPSEAGRIIGIA